MPPRSKAPNFPIAPILEELGGDQVPRIRGGGHKKMRCPFHDDSTPSASVSEFGFRCWACGKTGDAISLLREEEGLTYADAVTRAEELTGGGDQPERDTGWSGLRLLG